MRFVSFVNCVVLHSPCSGLIPILRVSSRRPFFTDWLIANFCAVRWSVRVNYEDDSDRFFSYSECMQAMLHFIYRDVLPDTNEITGSTSSSSTLMAQHLLAAADRYGLDRLRLLCESKLCEDVSTDTVATTLALAEQHHASQLKAVCLKYAATPTNLAGVLQSCPIVAGALFRMFWSRFSPISETRCCCPLFLLWQR